MVWPGTANGRSAARNPAQSRARMTPNRQVNSSLARCPTQRSATGCFDRISMPSLTTGPNRVSRRRSVTGARPRTAMVSSRTVIGSDETSTSSLLAACRLVPPQAMWWFRPSPITGRPGIISPTASRPGACRAATSQSGGRAIPRWGSEAISPEPVAERPAGTTAELLPAEQRHRGLRPDAPARAACRPPAFGGTVRSTSARASAPAPAAAGRTRATTRRGRQPVTLSRSARVHGCGATSNRRSS